MLTFYIHDMLGDGVTRCTIGDVVDIQESKGTITVPYTGIYRILRIETTRTKADVMSYMNSKTGTGAAKREWYLDTTKMSAAHLAEWNTNRYIVVPEATAISWLSRK